ncbi:MAG TPA: M28 family peptidase [Candidatus Thermoplasmatota archaeon]|nr:M28 family peptidase [Candidatus Thermoplasmatota archaeon]
MRATLLPALLLMAGLAGCLTGDPLTTTSGPASLPATFAVPAVPKVDAKMLLADHAAFVTKNPERAANVATHESARIDLLERFESYGLDAVRFNFTDGIPQANILGIKWGVDRQNWVFVGAHYDTTTDDCLVAGTPKVNRSPLPTVPSVSNPCALRARSQGAYDDGSGTLMTMHLAKAYANVSTYYTLAFVAFDGEERGLQGALAMVRAIQEGNFTHEGITPTIVGDLDLDMIGLNWPGVMAPINLITNTEQGAALVLAKAKEMGFPDGQVKHKEGLALGQSDYAAFWSIAEPAPVPTIFFISDFEELGLPNVQGQTPSQAHTPIGAYPFWHLEDTVETMTLMAGGQANLEAGFQSAADLASYVVHFLAADPESRPTDAVAK